MASPFARKNGAVSSARYAAYPTRGPLTSERPPNNQALVTPRTTFKSCATIQHGPREVKTSASPRNQSMPKSDLEAMLLDALIHDWGYAVGSAGLRQALGYPTQAALRATIARGALQVRVFEIKGREGALALAHDLAAWLAPRRQELRSTETGAEGSHLVWLRFRFRAAPDAPKASRVTRPLEKTCLDRGWPPNQHRSYHPSNS